MPVTSPFPDVEIPDVDLWSFLFDREEPSKVDKPIFVDVIDSKRFLTFQALKRASSSFGAALCTQWNWQRGDTLGIFGLNDIDYVTATLGALWAGATVSPMSFTFTAKELAFQLKNSGSKAIIVHPHGLSIVEEAARQVGLPSSRILLFGEAGRNHAKYKNFSQLGCSSLPSRWRIEPTKDVALLIYSSGTTGFPKGAKLSHTNVVANICQLSAAEKAPPSPGYSPKLLAFLPFAHIYATTMLMFLPLVSGTPVYVMPKFDLEVCLRSIQEHKITYVYIAPPVALIFAKHPLVDKFNLTSLRGFLSAAAPLAPQLVKDIHKRLNVTTKQAYGLSETAPTVTIQQWPNALACRGSIGMLLPNHTVKLVSETGVEVPPGQTGELWIKGKNVFMGYHNNEQATKDAFSEDGFFKTGDIAYQDLEGNFWITDRLKELIKYRGYQVAPAELEATLLQNPKVADVAVLGIYDERIVSEVPRAFVQLAPGLEPTQELGEEIAKWMDSRVSYTKKLRGGVQFIHEVPKSAAGKILRRVLKNKYGAQTAEPRSAKL
ncbi:acetyl-CoA synthetase-like protein [Rhizodiscina lignyota]|uniref:Acetyl-CoA synthetase-like protein n=1 Tax=Rhizodiscina lignyota TaxID=1504668 RepID=A0A9P4I8L4_9PEZI|nr:acetyl-CoA synthetase-like protein [Rhizodiscina lignyota]